MTRQGEIRQAILRILKDEVPQVPDWQYAVKGFNRSKTIEGTIACDSVSFIRDYKGEEEALASYKIYIIDPDNSGDVEEIAFLIREVFIKNSSLDNWATDCLIKNMYFGIAQGARNAGAAVIDLEVKFDLIATHEEREE